MKRNLFIILLLAVDAHAQMQSITTYGNNSWPQTTTIWPQPGGGYNYTRIGNGGPAWGGVTAAPGTTVSAAIGSRGGVIPIVSPQASYLDGINAQQDAVRANLEAQTAALLSAPVVVPAGNQRQAYNQGYQDAKKEAQYEADKAEVKKIKASITDTNLLHADALRDLGLKSGDKIDARDLLGYLRLWVRTHPESTTNSVLPSAQKR